MKRITIILILTVLSMSLLVLLLSGCSDTPTDSNKTGGLAMNITVGSSSELIQQVSQYELEASGAFGSLVTPLHVQDGMLVGEMEVPAGLVHFTARAYDLQGVLLYQGETDVTVVPDQVTPVNISLSPVVSMIKLSPRYLTVQEYGTFAVTVQIFNIPHLNQVSFRLRYNWDFVYPDSVVKNPDLGADVLLFDTVLFSTNGWAMSVINTSEIDTLVNSSGDVTLATAYFTQSYPVQATQQRADTTAITISGLTMYDFDGEELLPEVVYYDSSVVVIQADTTPFVPPREAIVPLAADNFWTYIQYDDSGVANTNSTLAITGVDTISYQNQNHEVYFWNWLDSEGQPSSSYWLVKNTDSGMALMGYVLNDVMDSSNIDLGLVFKYPAAIGETWYFDDVYQRSYMECVDTNQLIETPAGTFNCYVYLISFAQGQKNNRLTTGNLLHSSFGQVVQSASPQQGLYLYCVPGVGYVGMGSTPDGSDMSGGFLLYKYSVR